MFEVKCLLITSLKKHTLFLPLSVSVVDNCSIVTLIPVFWTRCDGLNISEFPSQSPSLHAATLLQDREKKTPWIIIIITKSHSYGHGIGRKQKGRVNLEKEI